MGLVAGQSQVQLRRPEDFQRFRQGFGDKDEAATVILALVGGPVGILTVATHFASGQADPQGRADRHRPRPLAAQLPPGTERQPLRLDAWRGPGLLGHPAALTLQIAGLRRDVVLHPGPQHRFLHDPGVAAFQPVVAPAQHLLQPADRRFHRHVMREGMRPGADQAKARAFQPGQQARHGFGIVVGPARDGIDRDGDLAEILADAALPPVIVARLVGQPGHDPGRVGLHPVLPHLPPALAHDGGIGRQVLRGEHGRGPVEVVL